MITIRLMRVQAPPLKLAETLNLSTPTRLGFWRAKLETGGNQSVIAAHTDPNGEFLR
jgi:hypothetical protein